MAGFPGGSLTKIRKVRIDTTQRTKTMNSARRIRYRVTVDVPA
jgi:hypothetical protein